MPDPAPTRRESSKAVPVGEPPTPEGWPKTVYVCSQCPEIAVAVPKHWSGRGPYHWSYGEDGVGHTHDLAPVRVAPVGGTGQEPWSAGTREAVRAALLPYLSVACSDCGGSGEARDSQSACRFCSGTGAKRGLSAVIDEAVDAALAGVGGTGVRLTREEAKALHHALNGYEADPEPYRSGKQKLVALAVEGAASAGEGDEDG